MSTVDPLNQKQHTQRLSQGNIYVGQDWDILPSVFENQLQLASANGKPMVTKYGFVDSEYRVHCSTRGYNIHSAYFRMNDYAWHQYVAVDIKGNVFTNIDQFKNKREFDAIMSGNTTNNNKQESA